MNTRLLRLALLLFLVSAFASVKAQGGEELTTVRNEAVTYTFLSRFAPVIGTSAENGSITLVEDPTFNYTLTYTPNEDFLGSDAFLLVSFPFGINVAFTQFQVNVVEADVDCRHDFAVTTAGQSVSIPVGDNDYSNVGNLELVAAPVVNAGTAEVVNGEIVFTPAPGFVGLTDLNYVSCAYGACDLGTVSINVQPAAAATAGDTLRVFAPRAGQYIFVPEGATPQSAPLNGRMIDSNGVMAYVPDPGFLGDEFLTYSVAGSAQPLVFHVTALDVARNQFAVEDRGYTTTDNPVKLNVLRNDLYSVFADCVSFGAPRFGSLTESTATGEVVYTPPPGWTGVDEFSYSSQPPGCVGEPEVETVYVVVSNFSPAAEEHHLYATAGNPLTVTYDIPGGAASWSTLTAPRYGAMVTNPENGQLSYLPRPDAAGNTDAFTLRYCLNEGPTGECEYATEVPVSVTIAATDVNACSDDCVWPGDTNDDGVVDVSDLLPIGLAMGTTGTPRLTAAPTSWSAQTAEDWGTDLNGLDLKHVDANGDQIISSLDTQVIMRNLGLAHRLRPATAPFSQAEISLVGPLDAEPGDRVILDIVAGTAGVVVVDGLGFKLPFKYNTEIINPNSVEMAFHEDSWLSYDSPILSLQQNDGNKGVINGAVTRTNGVGIDGFGKIGELSVVVVDGLGFRATMNEPNRDAKEIITIIGGDESATTMSAAGHLNSVRVRPFTLAVKQSAPTDATAFTPSVAADYLDGKLQAFPNPTSDRLTVHLNGQQRFSTLRLTDLTGRTLRFLQGLDTNHQELLLGDLANGIYTLTLTTEAGVVNRKIEVLR